MNSSGGYVDSTLAIGRAITLLRAQGHVVYFYAYDVCVSGCFVLSTFADYVYLLEGTRFGFTHSYEEVNDFVQIIETTIFLNRGVSAPIFQKTMDRLLTNDEALSMRLVDKWVDFVPLVPFDKNDLQIRLYSNWKLEGLGN